MASNSNFCYFLNAPIRSPPPIQTWNENFSRFYHPKYLQSIDIQQRQQQQQQRRRAVVMNYCNEHSPNIQVSNEILYFPDKYPESGEDEEPESGEDKKPESGEVVPLQSSNLDSKPNDLPFHGKEEFESGMINMPFSYDVKGNEYNGLGIIIVNDKCGHREDGERKGSHEDLRNYQELFDAMKLKTIVLRNRENIEKLLMEIEANLEGNNKLKSFFIAISTHGCMEKGMKNCFYMMAQVLRLMR